MQTSVSKLTTKYQATIPEPVRKLLSLEAGDSISFDIKGAQVSLRKARAVDLAFARAVGETLTEWSSENDEDAYSDL